MLPIDKDSRAILIIGACEYEPLAVDYPGIPQPSAQPLDSVSEIIRLERCGAHESPCILPSHFVSRNQECSPHLELIAARESRLVPSNNASLVVDK